MTMRMQHITELSKIFIPMGKELLKTNGRWPEWDSYYSPTHDVSNSVAELYNEIDPEILSLFSEYIPNGPDGCSLSLIESMNICPWVETQELIA